MSTEVTKDGKYYESLIKQAIQTVMEKMSAAESALTDPNLQEEQSEKLYMAIGTAKLLLSKRFTQFQEMVNAHLNGHPDGIHQVYLDDLKSLWEINEEQLNEALKLFSQANIH